MLAVQSSATARWFWYGQAVSVLLFSCPARRIWSVTWEMP